MKRITIYGASDDLVEVEASDGSVSEEYDLPWKESITLRLTHADHAVDVQVEYGAKEWELSIKAVTDGARWPYPITIGARPEAHHEEDPALIFECPVETTVELLQGEN